MLRCIFEASVEEEGKCLSETNRKKNEEENEKWQPDCVN